MRKHLLFLLFLFIGFTGFSQIEVSPSTVDLVTDVSVHDAIAEFRVTNTSTDTLTVWWRLNVENAPEQSEGSTP